MFHVFEWEGPTEEFPAESELDQFIAQECLPAFEAYVGRSYQESRYDIQTLVPSEASWDDGDHEFVCSAYDPANAQLTASVRNSGE